MTKARQFWWVVATLCAAALPVWLAVAWSDEPAEATPDNAAQSAPLDDASPADDQLLQRLPAVKRSARTASRPPESSPSPSVAPDSPAPPPWPPPQPFERLPPVFDDNPAHVAPQFATARNLQDSAPRPLPATPAPRDTTTAPANTRGLSSSFGSSPTAQQSVRPDLRGPATNFAQQAEAKLRATTDTGNFLSKANGMLNVQTQARTPVNNDIRVRGDRIGQITPNGSYWVPARYDLDTMLSKIDSRNVREVTVVKGPYSVRYGPGFNFVDVELLGSPRYEDGFHGEGSTSIEYKTNGEQWYGRQSLWGGAEDWGYRFSYGHRTGNDYTTGAGTDIPASYNSRNLDASIGFDLADDSRIEFNYMRLDQTHMEFPGLVFDINFLVTDAFELTYVRENQPEYDLWQFETWYNRTRFAGDTFSPAKNRQIPTLAANLYPYDGSGSTLMIDPTIINDLNPANPKLGKGTAITDVDQLSSGFSSLMTWGRNGESQLTAGVDFRYVAQSLNDIENQRPPTSSNFPIPPSYAANPGVLVDWIEPLGNDVVIRAGARADWVQTDAKNYLPTLAVPMTESLAVDTLGRNFALWSAFVNGDYALDDDWTIVAGAGYSQRPPTLTELYANGSFIGVLQTGLTAVTGDPNLQPEQRAQLDLGLQADLDRFRGSANVFYAWVHDYVTFDARSIPTSLLGQKIYRVAFMNTDLATLGGYELYGEYDVTSYVTGFATLNYVEGRDHSRNAPSRYRAVGYRSDVNRPEEPLPGISPLQARLGVRFHEAVSDPPWGVELSARMVNQQSRIAASLGEQETAGFTVVNLRSYWRPREKLLLIAGVENLLDRYYREHLDYRSGLGVFQPGINFYFSTELSY